MTSEREKMLAGELCDPNDPALVASRLRVRALCDELNATRVSQVDERRQLLREIFGAGGDTVNLEPTFKCDYGTNITLGERVYMNFDCVILDVCPVRIGSFVQMGPRVQLLTPLHPFDAIERRGKEYGAPITIGDDVWIGGGAMVLPGVTIGARSVIGAGSVVTRDIPAGVVAVGNPCRVLKAL